MWESLVEYFNTLEQRPLERLAFIVGSLLILWMIEGAIPLLPLKYKKNKTRHAAVNLVFYSTTYHYSYGFWCSNCSAFRLGGR